MGMTKDRRRAIDAHAASFADEAIEDYGSEADRVMLACLQHPGYGAAERYCFRRVRQELRRRGVPAARAEHGWCARLEKAARTLLAVAIPRADSRAPAAISPPAAAPASRSGA